MSEIQKLGKLKQLLPNYRMKRGLFILMDTQKVGEEIGIPRKTIRYKPNSLFL